MISEDDYIRIGVITGAHGLDGRVRVYVTSDIPGRFEPGRNVIISCEAGSSKHRIEQFTEQKGKTALVRFDGVSDRNSAASIKGGSIYIDKSTAEKTRKDLLEDDSYYYYDLIGCEVFIGGALFGEVTDIFKAGAGDILVITDVSGKDRMVPFVGSMVDTAGIKNRRIDVNPVEGLFEI